MNRFFYFSNVMGKGISARAISVAASMCIGLGLSACSDSTETAGGGPSGTEAGNAITAQLYTAGNTPAALAKVKIIDSESVDGTKNAHVAEADSSGKVVVEGITDGNYIMEASLGGKAAQVNFEVTDGDVDLGSAKLVATAEISGKVEGSGIVKVRGMDHFATVTDGMFSMDSIPAGPLSLVFIPDEAGDTASSYLKTTEGAKMETTTFAEENVYLLLDDLQDSNYQNRFMPAHTYDGGWWYFAYDKNDVTPTVITDDLKPVLENEDGNISIHAGATFGDTYTDSLGETHWPWATLGVELGKSDKMLCNDISSVDSIAFKAKGSGNIIFTLINETKETENKEIMEYEFSASSDWTRQSISLKAAIFPNDSLNCVNQLTWKLVSPAVPATEDNPNPAMELWLDDIQLIGGNRLDIWER